MLDSLQLRGPCQAPLSTGFPRQEYWSGLPFPSPEDLLDPGIEAGSPALQADALPSEPPGEPTSAHYFPQIVLMKPRLPTVESLASKFQGLCAASEQLGSIFLKLLLGLWKSGFPPNFLARTSSSACWCSHTLVCPRVSSLLPFAVHTPHILSM